MNNKTIKATETETYKKLTEKRPITEIHEIALKISDEIEKQVNLTRQELDQNPIPDTEDEQFYEKIKKHSQARKIHTAYFKLEMAIWRYANCQRRSEKMSDTLYTAIYEALELGIEIL